ncbi:unnamed protein product [Parnassius mnemosyne]|uniref:Uncharacterized protein n=1 Tax=Parnassius mnemosyne TaxID=213953 RepID=A0AAV1KA11_9NEOP
MLLQRLWESKMDWDDLVSADVLKEWSAFANNLKQIKAINIPRHVLHPSSNTPVSVELHCFVDSSQSAFAACVFIRCTDQEDNISVKLLCAKARVSSLKPSTISRLELAQSSTKVCQSLNHGITRVADFTTARGVIQRALGRVCLLPTTNPEDESLGNKGSQGRESVHSHGT